MSREIKFRAIAECNYNWDGYNKTKRISNGQWVYGHHFTEPMDNEDKCSFDFIPHIRMPYGDHSADIEINPDTLGQFTGLKDKNGKDIYEGDIVDWEDGRGEVYFDEGNFRHGYTEKDEDGNLTDWHRPSKRMFSKLEVIGNIHENPELLEQGNEPKE